MEIKTLNETFTWWGWGKIQVTSWWPEAYYQKQFHSRLLLLKAGKVLIPIPLFLLQGATKCIKSRIPLLLLRGSDIWPEFWKISKKEPDKIEWGENISGGIQRVWGGREISLVKKTRTQYGCSIGKDGDCHTEELKRWMGCTTLGLCEESSLLILFSL